MTKKSDRRKRRDQSGINFQQSPQSKKGAKVVGPGRIRGPAPRMGPVTDAVNLAIYGRHPRTGK